MLEIKSVTWQNFLSFGDYQTTINFENLGQCLITGEVIDDEKTLSGSSQNPSNIIRSNGAGKSTCVSVMQWVLFGRTMHSTSPGNKVINWFTGKDCFGKIEFKNGDSITRTRSVNGHDELIYFKDGDKTELTSNTLSTSKNQQNKLNKDFGLDWETFSGSVFFNQYGKPWMEMADQTRKKAIERILHIDKFEYYSKVAKAKYDAIDTQIERQKTKKQSLEEENQRIRQQIERTTQASEAYNDNKTKRIQQIQQMILQEEQKQSKIQLPDLIKLQTKWEIVKKIKEKLEEKRRLSRELSDKIATINGTISSLRDKIELWQKKSGKVCMSCEQEVPAQHVSGKIGPIRQKLDSETIKINEEHTKKKQIDEEIKQIQQILVQKSPSTTLIEAKDTHQSWQRCDKEINRLKSAIETTKNEQNPHNTSIEELEGKINKNNDNIAEAEKEVERFNFLSRHYLYINRAYGDRSKIKSYIFQEHIPFINSRLKHYLDVFGLDIHIELTNSLSISSNLWGYEFESGGERKRTDVAFMLAMFDFHEQMYGRQCNILVLDEVDGRLDDDGIDSLINIIKNDLASKVEAILIISHRQHMQDVFPSQILVKRSNRFSQIEYSL